MILLGVLLTVVGNIIIALSFTGLKRAHNNHPHAPHRSASFWLAMAGMAPGELLNLAAYAWAPATVVSPLGAMGVIASAVFARLFLGETFRVFGYAGIGLCVCGGVLVCASMPESSTVNVLEVAAANAGGVFSQIMIVLLTAALVSAVSPAVLPVTLCLSVCGVVCSLACRAVAGGFMYRDSNPGVYWCAMCIAVLTIALQCTQFQRALSHHTLSVVVSAMFCEMQVGIALTAGVLFDDLRGTALPIFIPGLILCCVGCFCITRARAQTKAAFIPLN